MAPSTFANTIVPWVCPENTTSEHESCLTQCTGAVWALVWLTAASCTSAKTLVTESTGVEVVVVAVVVVTVVLVVVFWQRRAASRCSDSAPPAHFIAIAPVQCLCATRALCSLAPPQIDFHAGTDLQPGVVSLKSPRGLSLQPPLHLKSSILQPVLSGHLQPCPSWCPSQLPTNTATDGS